MADLHATEGLDLTGLIDTWTKGQVQQNGGSLDLIYSVILGGYALQTHCLIFLGFGLNCFEACVCTCVCVHVHVCLCVFMCVDWHGDCRLSVGVSNPCLVYKQRTYFKDKSHEKIINSLAFI